MEIATRGAILFWIWCAVFGATVTALGIFLGWKSIVGLVAGMGMVLLAVWMVDNHEQHEGRSWEPVETHHDCNEHAW